MTVTVYECSDCGERQATRRCPDCNIFTRRLGPGGPCPHCDEPVLVTELLEETNHPNAPSYTEVLTSPQALDRTAPILPLRPGLPESRTHDYIRHGTTTLFAALEVATGKITDACYPRHRHQELLAFLKQVAKAYPRRELHVVADNYATHKHPAVKAWLARNPRITLHFTPTSGSWLNLVEVFFGIITRQAIRRGTFTSVPNLIAAIETYIDAWNERCHPFTWTKDPDTILAKATHPKNRNTNTESVTRH